jgi:membrane-bound lytic murein transglycosylase B
VRNAANDRPLKTAPLAPFDATQTVQPLDLASINDDSAWHPQQRQVPPPAASAPVVNLPANLGAAASSIPRRVLASYVNAADLADKASPACHLKWQTLAGIGFIESDHAASGGSSAKHWNGVANPPIYGPSLDGAGKDAQIANTEPQIDGTGAWARAVGPMQFIPSTWARWAADGNGDGVKNPEDIDDATLAAGDYLCAVSSDLNKPKNLIRAVHAYNHSYTYVKDVLTAAAHYENIDPKKLGIDGLPGQHKKKKAHHPKAPTHVPATPSGRPTVRPSTAPTTTSTPTPTPTPSTPSPSTPPDSPTPTPSQSAPGHVPTRAPRQ